jgi:hypothetical protein
VWHLAGPETATTRQILDLVSTDVGQPAGIRSVPKPLLRALGLFNPTMRALAEMTYEFEEPFVLDTTKYTTIFGAGGTALAEAIRATVNSYRGTSIQGGPPTRAGNAPL